MVFKKRNLILLVIILLGFTCGVTYAYFGTDIIKDKINPLGIRTGELYINIDDEEIHLDKMAPIYDNDYEHGFKKSFDIVLDSKSLNSCTKLYLNIKKISEELRSKDFKFKIVSSDDKTVYGNFDTLEDKILLLDTGYFKSGQVKNYILYIWLSNNTEVNQIDMLGGSLSAYLSVEGSDVVDAKYCEGNIYNYVSEENDKENIVAIGDMCFKAFMSNDNVKLGYYGSYVDGVCNNVTLNGTYGNYEFDKGEAYNILNTWYLENIYNKDNSSKVIDNVYCSKYDEEECVVEYKYSVGSKIGNGKLMYPVALPSKTEAIVLSENFNSFLTMETVDDGVFIFNDSLRVESINSKYNIIPVITVKNSLLVTFGEGSMDSPYIIN